MTKLKAITVSGLLVFSLALSFGFSVMPALAADLTFNADTTLSLPNGLSVTILNGGKVDSLTVNNDSTVSLTLGSDSNITIRSTNVYTIESTKGTVTCLGGNYSQVYITDTSGTATVTISSPQMCAADAGGGNNGGGGGGGGGTTVVTPTNTSVLINNGDAQTDSASVTLNLAATNAATMLIANKADFTDAGSWETYSTTKSWTLTEGVGTKTVYIKFRSSTGGESAAVSDTISLVAAVTPTAGEITGSAGGTLTSGDNKLVIVLPAGAISGDGTLSVTPSGNYQAPSGDSKVIGSKVYDLVMTVASSTVTTFNDFVTLTFSYTDEEVSGIDEASLKIYYWDATTQAWVQVGGQVDTANNTITVNVAHFTQFAVIGDLAKTGRLVKLVCVAGADVNDPCKAVYYVGKDSKRYVFPHEKVFYSWYADFSSVETVTSDTLAGYAIGGNVTYRPGSKMIKIESDPKVYAVAKNGVLRWVGTEEIAQSLYGSSWNTKIDDISAAFFVNYQTGAAINAVGDYNVNDALTGSPDINTDKGL